MAADSYQKATQESESDGENNDANACSQGEKDHEMTQIKQPPYWPFGSPVSGWTNSRTLDSGQPEKRDCPSFDSRLRGFIARNVPEEGLSYEDEIYVRQFKCVYVSFQSVVDWTEGQDILRCNPDFHSEPRYDCAIINDDAPGISVARLEDLVRCRLPSQKTVDFAVVRGFSPSKWRPRTVWAGCTVVQEDRETSFVMIDYLTRGALLCPVSQKTGEHTHYIVDTVDSDMFLRVNNWA